ncbi:hypothetical protein CEXT_454601 [Caerostris extrusa]|uniref:Uncharacterized protein n=1 Tax=Caerostris extrusa TaxID=172846 RepID=A0AAV4N829_CAEEX|nr:hypothetical protein CEXT_454601 [Caerostris extrusa]
MPYLLFLIRLQYAREKGLGRRVGESVGGGRSIKSVVVVVPAPANGNLAAEKPPTLLMAPVASAMTSQKGTGKGWTKGGGWIFKRRERFEERNKV